MEIKTSSWHYKYTNSIALDVDDVTNLCEYIRKFMFTTLVYLILMFLAFFIGLFILLLVARPFVAVFSYKVLFASVLCGVVFMALGFFIVKGCIHLWMVYDDSDFAYNRRQAKEERKEKDSSPFVQFIKDKHNKVCSTVKIVD